MLDSNKKPHAQRLAFWVALLTGAVVILRDVLLLRVFSFGALPDSDSYMRLGIDLRSVPYPLINTLLDARSNAAATIWFQIIIAGFAAGALVYVIGRRYPKLAAVIGLLFALDFTWSAATRWILTESPFTSFHVLGLACLINQYERNKRLHWWELLAAGVLYGWTMTIRPSGVLLVIPIVLAYLWFTRSWRKTSWLTAGVVSVLLISGLINLQYTGKFRLFSGTGYYVAFPLYVYHLYSPDNGPVSRRLDDLIRVCEPAIDYSKINMITHNDYLWVKFFPCLQDKHGLTLDQVSDLFTSAYIEAIRKQPVFYIQQIIAQHSTFISYPVGRTIDFWPLDTEGNGICRGEAWCIAARERARLYPELKMQLEDTIRTLSSFTVYSTQIQMAVASFLPGTGVQPLYSDYWQWPNNWSPQPLMSGLIAWLLMVGVLLLATRGLLRFTVLACIVFIHYTMLSVVAGHVITSRYIQVLSPFYIILSVITVAAAGQIVYRVAQRSAFGRTAIRMATLAAKTGAILLALVLVIGAIAIILTSRATAQWLAEHVADRSRLVAELHAGDVINLTETWSVAHTWDWKTVYEIDPKTASRWRENGAHYLLIDDRTRTDKPFAERLRTLEAQGAIIVYESANPLGLGYRQVVLWAFRPQYPINVSFDNKLFLIGYNVLKTPDGRTSLLLHWYTSRIPDIAYNLFVHLIDPDSGKIIAQADTPLGKGIHPTNTWRQNELVFEPVDLPSEISQKPYTIRIGLYNLATGARAEVQNAAQKSVGDFVELMLPKP